MWVVRRGKRKEEKKLVRNQSFLFHDNWKGSTFSGVRNVLFFSETFDIAVRESKRY